MSDIITREQFFNHPIDTVWKAISDEKEISTWFIDASFKAEPGFQYTFTRESTVIKGEVLTADPVHTLVYTWIVGDPNTVTTVSWRLKEVDGGTQLSLEHSGISGYPSEEMATNMFNGFSQGWDQCLSGLTSHLDN